MVNRILQVFATIFVVSTLTLLGWAKTEHLRSATTPAWPGHALITVSVITLPFALAKVVKESDRSSRRNWAILLGSCVALVILTSLLTGR